MIHLLVPLSAAYVIDRTAICIMASKAVNRPTNVKFKEQNVNDKLQLYGIWSAFAGGKVPSVGMPILA